MESGAPPGLHLLMGSNFGLMARNVGRGLQKGRIVVAQALAVKGYICHIPPYGICTLLTTE